MYEYYPNLTGMYKFTWRLPAIFCKDVILQEIFMTILQTQKTKDSVDQISKKLQYMHHLVSSYRQAVTRPTNPKKTSEQGRVSTAPQPMRVLSNGDNNEPGISQLADELSISSALILKYITTTRKALRARTNIEKAIKLGLIAQE